MSIASSFRALEHSNFRLYLFGQGVSIIGSWMQQVAMAWLAYQLSGSPVWLGVVGFAGQIPALFLTPFGGTLIDRFNRRRLLYITQSVSMVQAAVLAVLTLTGAVEIWHIVALSLLLGTMNALDIPTRQSFLSELVGKGDDLVNAIALNSSVFNGARLVGPGLAAMLLTWTSPGDCFVVNAISYLAVLTALWAMRLRQDDACNVGLSRTSRGTDAQPVLHGIAEGLAYAWRSKPIRSLLLLIGFFNLAGMAETTLLPIVATAVLKGEASTLGLLSAAAGFGAFSAAAFLATRRSVVGLSRWLVVTPVIFGLGTVAFSFADALWGAALMLVVTGFSLLLMTAGANTTLQTTVDERMRGRVMSLYTMAVTGVAPLGGLLAGILAAEVGAPITLRLSGLACLVGAAIFAVGLPHKPSLRLRSTMFNSSTARTTKGCCNASGSLPSKCLNA